MDCVAKCDGHDESDDKDEDVDSFEHNSVQEFESDPAELCFTQEFCCNFFTGVEGEIQAYLGGSARCYTKCHSS